LTMPKRLRHCCFVLGLSVCKLRPTDSVCGPMWSPYKVWPKKSTFPYPILHLLGFSDKLAFLTLSKKSHKIFICSVQFFVCPKTSSTWLSRFCVPFNNFLIIRLYFDPEFTIPNGIQMASLQTSSNLVN